MATTLAANRSSLTNIINYSISEKANANLNLKEIQIQSKSKYKSLLSSSSHSYKSIFRAWLSFWNLQLSTEYIDSAEDNVYDDDDNAADDDDDDVYDDVGVLRLRS